MSDQENTKTKPVPAQKSKRLSSLIWILVMWALVRLISEMDGLSWKRAFDGVSVMLGLWPATFFLGMSALPFVRAYQAIFRWSAFAVVLGSFFGEMLIFQALGNEGETENIIAAVHWAAMILVTAGVAVHWKLKKTKND